MSVVRNDHILSRPVWMVIGRKDDGNRSCVNVRYKCDIQPDRRLQIVPRSFALVLSRDNQQKESAAHVQK